MASVITELDNSPRPLDMFKIRSTGWAFKIALQSLNYYANTIFPLQCGEPDLWINPHRVLNFH